MTILGGGSWATALAHSLSYNVPEITLLVRDTSVATSITEQHCNTKYFPSYSLASHITATTLPSIACHNADIILYASAMQYARSFLTSIQEYIPTHAIFVSASKGIEEGSTKTMYEVIAEILPAYAPQCSVLSGPSFAKEVLENKFTTVVIASKDTATAQLLQHTFSTPTFRVYTSNDVQGVEIAGAVKNIIAIATGIVDVVEQSDNARAGIITRGLAEMVRLGVSLGAQQHTFMGLAGMGDLILTCTGGLSRNKHVGQELAKGYTMEEICKGMNNIAEGIFTCNAVYQLAMQRNIYMPITHAVYNLLHNKQTLSEIYTLFSSLDYKQEMI